MNNNNQNHGGTLRVFEGTIAEDASRTLEFMQEQLMVVDGLTAEICSNYIAKVNRNCQECLHGTDYFDN